MSVRLTGEGMDETKVINQVSKMWYEVRRPFSGLTSRSKFERALGEVALFSLKGDQVLTSRHGLTMSAPQFRFVIESIQLAHRPRTKNHQYLLSARGEVTLSCRIGVCGINVRSNWNGRCCIRFCVLCHQAILIE